MNASAATSRVAALALLAFAVPAASALLVFAVVPRGATVIYTWPAAFYAQLLCLAPLVVAALAVLRGGLWERPGWGARLALGLPALVLVASALASRLPRFSLEAALPPLFGLGVAWLVAGLAARHGARVATGIAALAGAGVVASTVLYLPGFAASLADEGWAGWARILVEARNPHPGGHWNYTGGYALLALPWLAAAALGARRGWRAVWWCAVAAGVFALVTSGSRGAVLGAAAGAATALALLAAARRWRPWMYAAAGGGALAALALLAFANPRLRALAADPASLFTPAEGDVQRLAMLEAGWLLLQRAPWLGHGPGLVPLAYPEVRDRLPGGVESAYQLHAAPVHVAAETGLAGVASCLAFPIVALAAWRRRVRADGAAAWTRAAAAGLAGYGVFALTDYQFHALAHAALCGALAGWLLAPAPGGGRPAVFAVWLPPVGAALAALVLVPGWRARAALADAWFAEPPARLEALERAADLAPWNPHLWNHAGFEAARMAGETDDAARRAALEERAARLLRRSLERASAQEPVHAALGWLELGRDPGASAAHFRAALRLLPDRPTLHVGLALASARLGERDNAARFLALEAVADPAFHALLPSLADALGVPAFQVDRELRLAWGTVASSPDVPLWRRPVLDYAGAFSLWWRTGELPSAEALEGAPPLAARFFADAPLRERLDAAYPEPVRWLQGASYGAQTEPPAALSAAAAAGARARLASRAGFLDLLRQPAPDGAGVVGSTALRGHFAIFWRNLDGPGYLDLAPRTFDAFSVEVAGFLFPPRGTVPGPVWRELRHER